MYKIVVMFIFLAITICISLWIEAQKEISERKAKQYKECVEQTLKILRAYNREPVEDEIVSVCIIKMTNTIFSEMMQYLPKEDTHEYRIQYHKNR